MVMAQSGDDGSAVGCARALSFATATQRMQGVGWRARPEPGSDGASTAYPVQKRYVGLQLKRLRVYSAFG